MLQQQLRNNLDSDESFQTAHPPSASPEKFPSHTPYHGHPRASSGRHGSGDEIRYAANTLLVLLRKFQSYLAVLLRETPLKTLFVPKKIGTTTQKVMGGLAVSMLEIL